MPDIVNVQYQQTGKSKSTNAYGMREMQERAFEYRDAQYLLIKFAEGDGTEMIPYQKGFRCQNLRITEFHSE